MKQLLWIVLIIAAFYLYVQVKDYWNAEKKRYPDLEQAARPAAPAGVNPENLPGLPEGLEASLQAAERQGAKGLQAWLAKYRPYVRDPRLAWIELDYVILISEDDPAEARRIFQSVKARTPPDSPVYGRIEKLEKTYE